MSKLLKYLIVLTVIHFSQGCEPYYKFVNRDIDEYNAVRYPWLVVIRNIRDSIFRLSYGSLIHPKAVLTSSLGLIGHTKRDIVVETNCQERMLLGYLKNCTSRNVTKIIHQGDPENLHTIENSYAILILETGFDRTDRINTISLASDTNGFWKHKCLYTRWMREYSTIANKTGLVTVAYHTPYNKGQYNSENWDYSQLAEDTDWLISRSYHRAFVNVSDRHLLNFIGTALACKTKEPFIERYTQVGIAAFRLTVIGLPNYTEVQVITQGPLIDTIPIHDEIMRKVNENV